MTDYLDEYRRPGGRLVALWMGTLMIVGALGCNEVQSASLVVGENDRDVGSVVEGAVIRHVFRVRNMGPGVAKLVTLSVSCACTAVLPKSPELAAGEAGEVVVTVDTAGMSGRIQPQAYIAADAPTPAPVLLRLRGQVLNEFVPDRRLIDFGTLPAGETAERTVRIQLPLRRSGDSRSTLVDVRSTDPLVVAELRQESQSAFVVAARRLTANRTGLHHGVVIIRTSSSLLPELRFATAGSVSDDSKARPR